MESASNSVSQAYRGKLVLIGIAFAALCAAHAAIGYGFTVFITQWQNDAIPNPFLAPLFIGAFGSRPFLLAILASFLPTRIVVGIVGGLTLIVITTLPAFRAVGPGEVALVWVVYESAFQLVMFSVVLAPCLVVRGLRHWRIQLGMDNRIVSLPRQWSLRALFVFAAAAALVFAGLRWLPTDDLRSVPAEELWGFAIDALFTGLLFGCPLVGLLPCVPLVLARYRRKGDLVLTLLGALLVVAWAVTAMAPTSGDGTAMLVPLGFYLFTLGSLLVLRFCGFRLTRKGDGDPVVEPTHDSAPATA